MESQLSQISFHLLTAEPVEGDVPAVDGAPESATNPLGCSEASYAFAALAGHLFAKRQIYAEFRLYLKA